MSELYRQERCSLLGEKSHTRAARVAVQGLGTEGSKALEYRGRLFLVKVKYSVTLLVTYNRY